MTQNRASAALEKRREEANSPEVKSLSSLIREMQGEFAKAMPRGTEAVRLVRDALTCVRTVPKLALCDHATVLGGLMTSAQLDLSVGVLGQSWVLPFYDRRSGGFKAQLIIGYQGYQELAHRSGKVASFMPRTVYTNDDFDIDYGVGGTLTHKPFRDGDRGPAIGYHSIARYANGGYDFLYMSKWEMDAHRDKYATTRDKNGVIFGTWIDHPDPMGNKTTQRLLSKSVPKSREMAVAAFVDGGLRIDLNPSHRPEDVTEEVLVGEIIGDDEARPADEDSPIGDSQRKHIMALASECELDRGQRISYYRQVLKRDGIESTSHLTHGDAERVIAALTSFRDQNAGPRE